MLMRKLEWHNIDGRDCRSTLDEPYIGWLSAGRRQRRHFVKNSGASGVSGALTLDELGHIFEILAKNELLTSGEDGHGAHAEFKQLRAPGSIVQTSTPLKAMLLFSKETLSFRGNCFNPVE